MEEEIIQTQDWTLMNILSDNLKESLF